VNPAEYERLRGLFVAVRDLAPEERRVVLDRAGLDAPSLRGELESLLQEHDRGTTFLSAPALGSRFDLARASPENPLVGLPASLGPYGVSRCLHESFFAAVFLADGADGHPVAVKVLRPGLESREISRRFEVEREALARMRHPNVARVLDGGVTDGSGPWAERPYLVMEYVEGRPITEHAERRRLGREERLRLFVAACEGVRHAHENGVIHRDIKPSNILVEERDGRAIPKLIDFGIAKAAEGRLVETELTLAGEVLGTLPYMAPEQLSGDPRGVDTRADVYALGVVLYELLCGRLPLEVEGVGLLEASRIVREVAPVPLGARDAALAGDVETIVAKALAKDRELRYRTVSEFAADVERHVEGRPVLARPPSTLYYLRKLAARHKRLVAAAGVVGLVMLAAIVQVVVAKREAITNYETSRQLTTSALALLLDSAIEQAPGMSSTRQRSLEELLPIADRFASQDTKDTEARTLQAGIQAALGHLYVDRSDVDRGEAAEDLIRRALATSREIARLHPENLDHQMRLSIVLAYLGDARRRSNDFEGAVRHYRECLAIDESLAASEPENRRYADNLGWSHHRIAWAFLNEDALEEAAAHYERMVFVFEALARDDPRDANAYAGIYSARRGLHAIATRRGDDPVSLRAHAEASLDAAKRLNYLRPSNRLAMGQLAAALGTVSMRALAECEYPVAEEHARRACDIHGAILRLDPEDARARVDLGTALVGLANIVCDLGDAEEELKLLDEGIPHFELLLDSAPSHREYIRPLAQALCRRGFLHASLQQPHRAREDQDRALSLLCELLLSEPLLPADMEACAAVLLRASPRGYHNQQEYFHWAMRAVRTRNPLHFYLLARSNIRKAGGG